MLKLRAGCQSGINQIAAAEENLISAANECCEVYQDMISAGVESREIEDVMRNVMFVRDEIKLHGIKSYYYRFDKANDFAAKYHCTPYEPGNGLEYCAQLKKEYISAAEEGLHEWWVRFYEALKNLLSKFVTWFQTTFTFRNRYLDKLKENKGKLDNLDIEKEVECMNCNDFDNILDVVYAIHEDIPKIKNAKDPDTISSLLKSALFINKKHLLNHIGYDVEIDDKEALYSITEMAEGLSDKCPIKKETLKQKQWSVAAAKRAVDDILRIESKANFKNTCGGIKDTIADIIDKGIDEMKKKRDEKGTTDETKDMIDKEVIQAIHVRGAFIRVVNKEMVIENRLMVRLIRTLLEIEDSCEEKKK